VRTSYKVVLTTNRFSIAELKATAGGVARMVLKLPGPGSLAVSASAWNDGAATAFRRHFVYVAARSRVRGAGAMSVTVKPNPQGRALVKLKGGAPVIALSVTYTPTGGRPREQRPARLRIR
jgi:hypothetical protein